MIFDEDLGFVEDVHTRLSEGFQRAQLRGVQLNSVEGWKVFNVNENDMVPPSFQLSANRLASNSRNCYFPVALVDVSHDNVTNEPSTEGGTFHVNVKVRFYIAQYPVRWNAQTAFHFTPSIPTPTRLLGDAFRHAVQLMCEDYRPTLALQSLSIGHTIVVYSFV